MAYRALFTGTTNCGPAILEISSSTFLVFITKSSFSFITYPISFKKEKYSSKLNFISFLYKPIIDFILKIFPFP